MEVDLFFYLGLFVTWLVLCFVVARVAKNKGRDATTYFFIAVFLSPLVGFIVLGVSGDSSDKKINEAIAKKDIEMQMEAAGKSQIQESMDRYDSLEKLGNLLDRGLISQSEFEKEKKKLFGEETSASIVESSSATSSSASLESVMNQLQGEINEAKSIISGVNEKVPEIIRNHCPNQQQADLFLLQYRKHHKKDLIKVLCKLSNQYEKIETYVAPFIELDMIEAEYPHRRKT